MEANPLPPAAPRWRRSRVGRLLAAVCLVATVACGEGSLPGPVGPSVISPQPIPENATGVSLDESTLSIRSASEGVIVGARIDGVAPGATSITVTNLQQKDSSVVRVVTLGTPFEVTLPGKPADTFRIEETDETTLALDVRFATDGTGSRHESCLLVEGAARNVQLPDVDAGTTYSLKLLVENKCDEDVVFARAQVFAAAPSPTIDLVPFVGLTVPRGGTSTVLVPFRANESGAFAPLVVLGATSKASDAERWVSGTRIRGKTR